MSEEKQLPAISITPEMAPAIFITGGLDQFLSQIKEAVNEVPDLSTKKGRDRVASLAAAVFAEPAPVIDPLPGPGEIAIAVVGAHMSGLPLNHQLTDRGGRFLRAARTSPDYRLFALRGGPPARPGLLRAEPGASIDARSSPP